MPTLDQWTPELHRSVIQLLVDQAERIEIINTHYCDLTDQKWYTLRRRSTSRQWTTAIYPWVFHNKERDENGYLIYYINDADGTPAPMKYKHISRP